MRKATVIHNTLIVVGIISIIAWLLISFGYSDKLDSELSFYISGNDLETAHTNLFFTTLVLFVIGSYLIFLFWNSIDKFILRRINKD